MGCLGVCLSCNKNLPFVLNLKKKPSSSQVFGFKSSYRIQEKALLHIGMEKIVPNKHSRRHSTGNLAFEYTEVPSRYLNDPISSCHDNCKQDNLKSERSNRAPPTPKSLFTPIPKLPTKDVKITNTSLKHQLKPLPFEPAKKHDFLKSKSKITSNDPFYIPPSKTHRRRYSEIILPTGGLGDVFDPPPVAGLTRRSSKKIDSKIEPRKVPNSNSKPANSVKTSGNVNISKKVQPLKTQNSLPKPGLEHGSRKSKPVGEIIQEKTDQTEKTCSSDERVSENGCDEAQISSTSKIDETLRSDDQNNGCSEEAQVPSTSKKNETLKSHDQNNVVALKRVGKLVKENGDYPPQKIKFKQGKVVDAQSGCSGPKKLNKVGKQVLDEKQNQDDNRVSLRRSSSNGHDVLHSSHESKSVIAVLKPQLHAEKNKRHSGLNNVIEETASKLIQTRKSRVQALVGAFEMISESQL